MLRLFSSIRKSLLNEKKTIKYMKYAVGEVLLIMIGIFLALQLNNWNDRRKNSAEEQQILRGLKVEFEGHLSGLNYRLIKTKENVSSMWLFMSHIAEPDSKYSITELDKGLFASMYGGTWDPANSMTKCTDIIWAFAVNNGY